MNVFQRIAGSPAPTKVAYGFCAGVVTISLAVIGISAAKNISTMNDTSAKESSLASLQVEYNNSLVDLQTADSVGTNIVQAELFDPSVNAERITLYENTIAHGQVLSDAEMVSLNTIMSGKTYAWLDTSDVTYEFVTDLGFTESSFVTVWSAVDSNGKILAYITAEYDSTTDTFDDFRVYRTLNYVPGSDEVTEPTYNPYTSGSTPVSPVEPTIPIYADETTESVTEETVVETIETSEVVEDA